MTIHVLPYNGPKPLFPWVPTTHNTGLYRHLSPFTLGPIRSYDGYNVPNLENLWQFSKVYPKLAGDDWCPTPEWFAWRAKGWADTYAHRYPMGKGAIPEFSWWDGKKLGYVAARKTIYAPFYAAAVRETASFTRLEQLYLDEANIVLLDFDAYDHHKLGMTLVDVINEPKRKMGHAFVLAMMLEGCLDACLESPTIRQAEMGI